MSVIFFWERAGGLTLSHRCNPYGPLLAQALEKLDIHLELGDYAFKKEDLKSKRNDFDALHINWLHHFYRADDFETAVKRLNEFAENLYYAQSLGYRIIWTMHNLYPHERPFPELDHLAQLIMCRVADEVIAHCNYAADLAREYFYRTDHMHVVPHGNYIDAYPNLISRQDARRELDIPESAFVYLFVGNARPYKGIERLIQAFQNVADEDCILLLMMRKGLNPEYGETIERLAEGDDKIRVFTSPFFATEEFQFYMNASDVAVLPFVDVLTSGSAILALSFGKPILLPQIGCLPELVDETMGHLFNPKDKTGLETALREIRERDLQAASHSALQRAKDLHWDGIAEKIAPLYKK